MRFTTTSVFFGLVAVLSTAWSTVALPVLQEREVFDPPITFPKAGDVFTAGQTITVTWDTSSIPAGTPNLGELVLRLEINGGSVGIGPLADGFLLTDGSQQITFPSNLTTSPNYILNLFGDSGNLSPAFTINAE
ncbi:hypothetical protein JB92DRAFT_2899680 [Gautieria morchelliformis]|nr:hypothetical protein JB92DRAFT_2899680 [Gautieria morchelliformis]